MCILHHWVYNLDRRELLLWQAVDENWILHCHFARLVLEAFLQTNFCLHGFQTLFLIDSAHASGADCNMRGSFLELAVSLQLHDARWVGTVRGSGIPGSCLYTERASSNFTIHGNDCESCKYIPLNSNWRSSHVTFHFNWTPEVPVATPVNLRGSQRGKRQRSSLIVVKIFYFCRFQNHMTCGYISGAPSRVLGGGVQVRALNFQRHCIHGKLTLVEVSKSSTVPIP